MAPIEEVTPAEGQNFIKARSVNKFGVAGHEHKIVLRVNQ